MLKTLALSVALCLAALSVPMYGAPPAANDLDAYFKPLKWRSIGPFRGGRSVAATGVVGDPNTYYMGTTGGGLWKTDNRGISWRNVSDGYFKTATIGAVAVAAADPNVVYVGMGEHAVRGVMTHSGDGVYRSTDAGKTWKHVGLAPTQHIARIVVHPKDPDTVLVAAQGALYSPSPERGVFKSTDGGATWKKVLFVNDKTGAAELSIDATNPRILYAAMWEHGRLPWQVISGGPGSGLYKSTDSGETWEKMTEGLPAEMGKMAIAVSPSSPETVYALVESDSAKDERGLYVSTNAGKKWTLVTSDPRLIQRAWYYTELFVDPQDVRTIYVLSAPALRSTDGGKTWQTLSGTHGDFHDMWISPDNPRNFVIANDGGADITFDAGKSWSGQDTQPTAQFYRVNVDNRFPYRIYGGQQDNTSVVIASRELGSEGITTASWKASAGGESAFLAFDPDNPRFVMGGSYQGTIDVIDTEATAGTNVMAAPIQYLGMDAKDMKYRFNWNAPIVRSRHEPNTYYHGAQVLLKTTDMGRTWTAISPDLTRNETSKQGTPGVPYTNEAVGAENYGTLAYVVESPHEKGVIWAGSDDGLVQLTRDGGTTWANVTPKGLAECLVNAIEVSPFDKATALHRHHALQVQRPRARALQDDGLRRDVDEDRPRYSRQRVHAGRARRRGPARFALCRHRTRPLHLLERRPGLVGVPAESAGHPDHRPARPSGQPRRGHLGPFLLDSGRPRPGPAVPDRHARRVPVPARSGGADQCRQRPGRSRGGHHRRPSHARGEPVERHRPLLPAARIEEDRRGEARDHGRGGQVRSARSRRRRTSPSRSGTGARAPKPCCRPQRG